MDIRTTCGEHAVLRKQAVEAFALGTKGVRANFTPYRSHDQVAIITDA